VSWKTWCQHVKTAVTTCATPAQHTQSYSQTHPLALHPALKHTSVSHLLPSHFCFPPIFLPCSLQALLRHDKPMHRKSGHVPHLRHLP
jgi:hypothetical protein